MGKLILVMKSPYYRAFLHKVWDENKHPRSDDGRFSEGGMDLNAQRTRIVESLDAMAAPMLEMEYTPENYNEYFKGGYVKTPLGIVKMGADQFAKLGRRERKSYIGAAYQTLTDPVVVIREGTDNIYIKSFINNDGVSTFVSVEKDKEDGRFVVTNYMRHKKEVEKKIKRADGIVYMKGDVDGSPARMGKGGVPHAEGSHTFIVLHKPKKKSSKILEKKQGVFNA